MITAYHRPRSVEEALHLLARKSPTSVPMGGGTYLATLAGEDVEVVDLQSVGLNRIERRHNELDLGAAATLQEVHDHDEAPHALKTAIEHEAPLNLRNMATVAGTLVVADGRSGFTTVLLALDAQMRILRAKAAPLRAGKAGRTVSTRTDAAAGAESYSMHLGDFLPRRECGPSGLIATIVIPLQAKVAFEYIARTPSDWPLICAALAVWPSGRVRLTLGGFGQTALLAMDGTGTDGTEAAARNAFHEASDTWASAEYRSAMAGVLANRCMARLESLP